MAQREAYFVWSLTSTGAAATVYGTAGQLHDVARLTLLVRSNGADDTAAIGFESGDNSTGFFDRLGSTLTTVSSGLTATLQYTGPFAVVRPYVISKTGSTTVVNFTLLGN